MAYKTLSADEKKARLAKARDMLNEKVASFADSDEWRKFLTQVARNKGNFHEYSFANQMMIMFQAPSATHVASFAKWKKLGRSVRKGEKGIGIYVPTPYRERDENGEVALDKNGDERMRMAFKIGYVFDYSQTEPAKNAKEVWEPATLESVATLQGTDEAGIAEAVQALLTSSGWKVATVDRLPDLPSARGVTRHGQRLVEVVASTGAQMAKTWLHEFAHVRMHADAAEDAPREVVETEAESVAFIVAEMFGLDTSAYSPAYVTAWSKGDTAILRATAERVLKHAREIADLLSPAVADE